MSESPEKSDHVLQIIVYSYQVNKYSVIEWAYRNRSFIGTQLLIFESRKVSYGEEDIIRAFDRLFVEIISRSKVLRHEGQGCDSVNQGEVFVVLVTNGNGHVVRGWVGALHRAGRNVGRVRLRLASSSINSS